MKNSGYKRNVAFLVQGLMDANENMLGFDISRTGIEGALNVKLKNYGEETFSDRKDYVNGFNLAVYTTPVLYVTKGIQVIANSRLIGHIVTKIDDMFGKIPKK